MKAFIRYAPIILIALLVSACAPHVPAESTGTGDFATLAVEPARTSPGGEVTITLTNRSGREIGYNLCPAVLDRRVGADWAQHPEAPAEVCTMELRILQPGASDSFRHSLPAGLTAGTYRFRLGVEWPLGDARVGVASGPFEVVR
ncbi:MAG TPA: hypothetical protein VK936_15880 [Longimicrobiales bacterium]|nr:hypothetical protein [Longimicrobiales bacterium]